MALPAKGDSLGRRYLFKLFSNMATIPLFFVLEAVLPRALGPSGYGNYNFATSLFQNFTNFLDMGTSTCLNTSLSKRPDEFGLVAFYARVAVGMFVLCAIAGLAVYVPGAGEWLMPDVPLWLALPAALWAYLTWAGRVARGMNDALGITARSELVRIGVNVLSALALLGLFYGGILDLPVLFGHQYVTLGLLALGFAWTLRGTWSGAGGVAVGGNSWRLTAEQRKSYARDFWQYSGPLFVMALCSALALSGERWMLQFFEGSVQQGYFSLSQKVGMACFLFVTAMTPLLMRELAVAHSRNNMQEMARLLDRFAPMMYAISAWLSCFTVVEAEAVVRLFGGAQFAGALLPVQIMALYPIHQGYGQVASAVFYATGQTRLLRNITLVTLLAGLGVAWALLAPHDLGGQALGASGLACKMVGMQFIAVNLLLFASRKVVPFNFRRNLLHQVVCPAVLLALAAAARYGTEAAGLGSAQDFFRFAVSGICYGLLSLAVMFVFPFIMGLGRGELRGQLHRFGRWAR